MSDILPLLVGVGLAVCASTVGDLFLAAGMRRVGVVTWNGIRGIPGQLKRVAKTPQISLAILFMAIFFFTWLALLSRADLSFILPMTAITYVLNGLAAGPVLGEKVSRRRWAGILVITIGVVLVTLTGDGTKT
jgi:drug/metabolite transporter (DMT)-like permease